MYCYCTKGRLRFLLNHRSNVFYKFACKRIQNKEDIQATTYVTMQTSKVVPASMQYKMRSSQLRIQEVISWADSIASVPIGKLYAAHELTYDMCILFLSHCATHALQTRSKRCDPWNAFQHSATKAAAEAPLQPAPSLFVSLPPSPPLPLPPSAGLPFATTSLTRRQRKCYASQTEMSKKAAPT